MSTSSAVLGLLALLLALAAWSRIGQVLIERRHPPLGAFVDVDGQRLHYVMAGEGPPLILLHGASSNLRDLHSRLLPLLTPHYRVIAFDRPGYGYSERPADWPDPADIARRVLDGAAQLGVERPLLVGHSWSGSVVMAALVEMPERIAGGALIAGVAGHWAGPINWTYSVGGLPIIGPLFAWTAVYPVGQFLLTNSVTEVLAPNPVPEGYVDDIGVRLALRPQTFRHNVEDMNRLSEYLQALSPRYDRIRLPLLLIHGEADTLVPWWNHGRRLLPVIPHAEVALLPDVGHAPHHSHPQAVAEALYRFYPAPVAPLR